MAQNNNELYGEDLKYLVNPTATGFDKLRDDWEVDITNGKVTLHFEKSDLVLDDGNFYVCFSTKDIGTGQYYITITAHIPDTDFDDNVRDEMWQGPLIPIAKPRK